MPVARLPMICSQNPCVLAHQCVHLAFRGARGVLNMYDRLVGDEVKSTYRGDIELRAVPDEEEIAPVVTLPKTAAKSLAQSGSSQRAGC